METHSKLVWKRAKAELVGCWVAQGFYWLLATAIFSTVSKEDIDALPTNTNAAR